MNNPIKNLSTLVLGLIGLFIFAALILGATYYPAVSAKFEMIAAIFGLLMAGELILLGLKK